MRHRFAAPLIALVTLVARSAAAEEAPPAPWATRFSVMSGVGQWAIFGGGNIATQVKFGRFVLEYSHGQALDYDRLGGFAKTSAEKDAGVSVFSPWTTGAGLGFQVTPRLHVLVELKAHRYEVTSPVGGELRYTTFSIGPGVFYDIYLYKGLFLQPNVRFWPNVGDTLGDRTLRLADGSAYMHEAHSLGFFANVNVGWTFSGI